MATKESKPRSPKKSPQKVSSAKISGSTPHRRTTIAVSYTPLTPTAIAPDAVTPSEGVAPSIAAPSTVKIDAETRLQMIRDAAYYKWENRDRASGHEAEDWAAAEQEIDALLHSRN
jgi:hypothetical protein